MSNQDNGYGGSLPFARQVRRPSHQGRSSGPSHVHDLPTRYKSHHDAPDTSHSFFRSPLFSSAVPQRLRTDTVKRPSNAWHDAARRMRQRHSAAVSSNGGRSFSRPTYQASETQVDTEQEHEVAEALFDLANMFARPAPPEPSRKMGSLGGTSHSMRPNGITAKVHRSRHEQPSYSPKRLASMPYRDGKRSNNSSSRDWHAGPDKASHTAGHLFDPEATLPNSNNNVSAPRALKAVQTAATAGSGPAGPGNSTPGALGSGAFHPGVGPPGLPAYFRTNGQAHDSSDAHSGHWQPAGTQQALHASSSTRDGQDNASATAFSKPSEGLPLPRPKSLRRSANHVYIAHMIVVWQRQLSQLKQQKPFAPQPSASSLNPLPYSASAFAAESTMARSNSNQAIQPARSSPVIPVKQESQSTASVPQHTTTQPPAPIATASSSAFQYAPPPFNLAAMRPPAQPAVGPRDPATGNIIPPYQYYKTMLGPQKFEALQPRLPLLQPGATWPIGPPPGPSHFGSAALPGLSPQQAAAFAAQMSMYAAGPHSFGALSGYPPASALQSQLANSQAMQAGLLRGVRWPDGKDQPVIQELPATSSSSPATSQSKPFKHEDAKPEPPAPAPGPAPGISTDALNRLIAMGGPAGFLDSHNLAQFGVPEHILQAINKPQSQQNQESRPPH